MAGFAKCVHAPILRVTGIGTAENCFLRADCKRRGRRCRPKVLLAVCTRSHSKVILLQVVGFEVAPFNHFKFTNFVMPTLGDVVFLYDLATLVFAPFFLKIFLLLPLLLLPACLFIFLVRACFFCFGSRVLL
jgi:hypothetical protein